MTTPTQNGIPSSTAIDVRFNAEKLDEIINSDNETYADRFGNSRFTLKGIVLSIQGFFSDLSDSTGFSQVEQIESFAKLRTTPVTKNGQRVLLGGYNPDSSLGGGEFVGRLGTATDDGGTIAVGDGFYWERVIQNGTVTPLMFGATPDKTKDSSSAFQNMFNSKYSTFDCLGESYGFLSSLSMTGSRKHLFNGKFYVLDGAKYTFLLGLNGDNCTFENLWCDCNGITSAGVFNALDPVKGVSGTTQCGSFISNQGTAHYTTIRGCYVTRTATSKPAFSFAGVDKCLYVSVIDCVVEFSGSMFFTMSAYNQVINPTCSNINDAGIAFNTGGAKYGTVKGGYVNNCRYGGIAIESGSRDIVIDGVTFVQPNAGAGGYVVSRGDILISSFDTASASCYNVDIINCKFSQGGNASATSASSYKQSIYITNGYNINIRGNTFVTSGFANDGTETNNTFIYLQLGISQKDIWNLNIKNNNVRYGTLLKIWSSVDNQFGNVMIEQNTFVSNGFVINVPSGNNVAYYAGKYQYGIKVGNNVLHTTKLISAAGNSLFYRDAEFTNNEILSGTVTILDTNQSNALKNRGVKITNRQGEYISDTIPAQGKWSVGDVVKRYTVTAGGVVGWVCSSSGTFSSGSWVSQTAYTLGNRVDKNGVVYECIVSGTSSTIGPVGTVVDVTEVDGTVTWKCLGAGTPTFIQLGVYSS